MSIKFSIEISDELGQLAQARAQHEGTTVPEVLRQKLEEFAIDQNAFQQLNNNSKK